MAKKTTQTYIYNGVKKNVRKNDYFTNHIIKTSILPKEAIICILSSMKLGVKMPSDFAHDVKVMAFNMLDPVSQDIVKSESAEFYSFQDETGKFVNKSIFKTQANDAHLLLQYLK